jgi:hypothetical protein
MKIIYTRLLTVKVLRRYAKLFNIRNYYKLTKKNLLVTLNIHKNVSHIQREFRKKTMLDTDCPISFEQLKYPFAVIKTNSKFKYYDLKTLVSYLKETRDFRDPSTRADICDDKVRELNTLMKYYYNQKNIDKLWTINMINETEFVTIVTCVNSIVTEIMASNVITINFIYTIFIPRMIHYFHNLIINNKSECRSLIQNCIFKIKDHESTNKFFILDFLNLIIIVNDL